ncbi:MAG: hypothetical protein NC121_12470 [Blautia sp.]|nr:hypothetical protein [Blautia sp.]
MLDMKKLYKSRLVQAALLMLLVAAVMDPVLMCFSSRRQENPFRWWMFMGRGIGAGIFHTFFWVFPALLTGAVFVDEKNTAVCGILLTKRRRGSYLFSKTLSAFTVAIFSTLALFLLNLGLVYLICPASAEIPEWDIPKAGTLAAGLFAGSPFVMALCYNLMAALAMALLTVLYQQIHMILRPKNKYVALLAPFLLMEALDYIVQNCQMERYSLTILLQPVAASAMTVILDSGCYVQVFGTLILADIILFFIAMGRNRDIL